jgi:hypothetical protein
VSDPNASGWQPLALVAGPSVVGIIDGTILFSTNIEYV